MAPQSKAKSVLCEDFKSVSSEAKNTSTASFERQKGRKWDIVWRNVIIFLVLHIGSVYGTYLYITTVMWKTMISLTVVGRLGGMGVTAGAHRLWSHKAYKARWPLRVLLVALNCIALQDCVIDWARDHRMHHRYTDTDADPYNSRRGFFFSHIGWLLVRKHPDIKAKGHTIDMSDLESDPILQFQKKYYAVLVIIFSMLLPVYIPILWGETLWNSFFVCGIFRYALSLNYTWLVNSAAHMWGCQPYDKTISPTENRFVSFVSCGEGFHNYHHTFPWDYKTAELGNYSLNLTKLFIDAMAKIGWAYDLKTAPVEVIQIRKQRLADNELHNRNSTVSAPLKHSAKISAL